jgi:hypothetical protein
VVKTWGQDVMGNRRIQPIAIILDDPKKRWKSYEKTAKANKITGLIERGYTVLELPTGRTNKEYQILIWRHMRLYKLKGE